MMNVEDRARRAAERTYRREKAKYDAGLLRTPIPEGSLVNDPDVMVIGDKSEFDDILLTESIMGVTDTWDALSEPAPIAKMRKDFKGLRRFADRAMNAKDARTRRVNQGHLCTELRRKKDEYLRAELRRKKDGCEADYESAWAWRSIRYSARAIGLRTSHDELLRVLQYPPDALRMLDHVLMRLVSQKKGGGRPATWKHPLVRAAIQEAKFAGERKAQIAKAIIGGRPPESIGDMETVERRVAEAMQK